MKTIVTFIAGAILASGLVYLVMSRNAPNERVQSSVEAPAAVPEAEAVAMPASPETPAASAIAEPSSNPVPARPSAVSPRQPITRSARVSKPEPPVTTATNSSTVPPPNPTAGPIIPYDPIRSSAPAEPVFRKPIEPKREPKTLTIPAGTLLNVRVDEMLSTERNKAGDTFRASLDQPLSIDGFVIAERGARLEGRIVESDPGGRVRGLSRLNLELVGLNTSDGQKIQLQTESFSKQGQKEMGRDAVKVGAAAGIGAAIGALAGGGKGAGIGAIVGGAAGTGGVMATRGAATRVPAETRVSFRLRDAVTVTERIP
ncbi:MAG: hypothetical protein H7Y20_15815 [Bryobacteraceae bacterium]|nr:hypothetical protein [Bryobacteraceae bacterium]